MPPLRYKDDLNATEVEPRGIYINYRVNLFDMVFVLLLGLKLTGRIDHAWWIITAPLWVPVLIGTIIDLNDWHRRQSTQKRK